MAIVLSELFAIYTTRLNYRMGFLLFTFHICFLVAGMWQTNGIF
jgi:hypothetical protein